MRILNTKQEMLEVRHILNRRPEFQAKAELTAQVGAMIAAVREHGDQALLDYEAKFDRVQLTSDKLRVTPAELQQACTEVDTEFVTAVEQAKENILAFHQKQLPKDWLDLKPEGMVLGQRYLPVEAAGLYVPGGTGGMTPLVSSVLMNALPAKAAGVARLVICTPPNVQGKINPQLLYTAIICGVTEIYKVGSAWAIAALAYGTESIAPVDVIVGPGNQYVTEAKRQVYGYVGLDMLAGPSEILIIADAENKPEFIAADLLSQAEHGPVDEAGAFLLTTSVELAEAVAVEVEMQLAKLSRAEIARASLAKSGAIIVTENLEQAFELANYTAPEHLELLIAEPWNYLCKIKHAGAVFLGPYSTEPIGDYIAGSNHVLPTYCTARFASGLNVDHFLKKTSLIGYNQAGIAKYGQAAVKLAEVEGLDAHAHAVRVRIDSLKGS